MTYLNHFVTFLGMDLPVKNHIDGTIMPKCMFSLCRYRYIIYMLLKRLDLCITYFLVIFVFCAITNRKYKKAHYGKQLRPKPCMRLLTIYRRILGPTLRKSTISRNFGGVGFSHAWKSASTPSYNKVYI